MIGSLILLSQHYFSLSMLGVDIQNLYSKKIFKLVLALIGIPLVFLVLFFPIYPGPEIFGDLLVSINILALVLYYFYGYKHEEDNGLQFLKLKLSLGWEIAIVTILHFVLPNFVII